MAGDFNQNIQSYEIQQFFTEIGVQDHSQYNQILLENLDKTYIYGIYPIDSITRLEGICEYIEGYVLIGNNEIVHSDYRANIIDFNIEEYF